MKFTTNVFGAILAASAIMFIAAAGATGQLFTITGNVTQMPAYGSSASPLPSNPGYIDPLAYDERGQVIDFGHFTNPDLAEVAAEEGPHPEVCAEQTFQYDMNYLRFWKRGFNMEPTRQALVADIDKILSTCSPVLKNQAPMRCEPGCTAETTNVQKGELEVQMQSANYYLGAMQYIFVANGSCTRVLKCN